MVDHSTHAAPGPVVPLPAEGAVRDVVRRVVDAMLDGRDPARAMPVPVSTSGSAVTAAGPAAAPAGATTAGGEAAGPRAGGSIALGADHGGVRLKDLIAHTLAGEGWAIHDCGTTTPDPVDYPDFAHAVARLVADGTCSAGIVVDGAGIGSCMAANKVPGVRAALCHDISTARNSREHNHANVLTLGGRLIGDGLALDIVRAWLGTPWGGGRHGARVDKITEIEHRYLRAAAGDEGR